MARSLGTHHGTIHDGVQFKKDVEEKQVRARDDGEMRRVLRDLQKRLQALETAQPSSTVVAASPVQQPSLLWPVGCFLSASAGTVAAPHLEVLFQWLKASCF